MFGALQLGLGLTRGQGDGVFGVPLDNEAFTVSDYAIIAQQTPTRLRFQRPIVEAGNSRWASPGSRVSFETDSTTLTLRFHWTALVTLHSAFQSVGVVLVDGSAIDTFESPYEASETGYSTHEFSLGAGTKTVSIVWPYAAAVDLVGIRLDEGASLASVSRPATAIAIEGDSNAQGLKASDIAHTWPFLLADALSLQLVNLANGGASVNAADGTALSYASAATRVIYMTLFNNFAGQTALAAVETSIGNWITNARNALPNAELCLTSPIYSTKVASDYGGVLELADYRASMQAAVIGAGDGVTYVDGLTLMTNSSDRLAADGIHVNDTGGAEISASYQSLFAGALETLNPSDKAAGLTLSADNYEVIGDASGTWKSVRGTIGRSSGAYYFEWVVTAVPVSNGIIGGLGNSSASLANFAGATASSIGTRHEFAQAAGSITLDGGSPTSSGPLVIGTRFMCAVDLDNGNIFLGRDGSWFGGTTPEVGSTTGRKGHFTPPLTLYPMLSCFNEMAGRIAAHTGQLAYAPPSGFLPWSGR